MGIEITEKQFSQQVEDLLNLYGWHWCHFRPARTEEGWRTALSGHQGFPDYIATHPPRLIFAELKSEKGKITPEQEEWLGMLRECGSYPSSSFLDDKGLTLVYQRLGVYLWRPSDFETIIEILKR